MSSRWKKVWADFWSNKSRTFLTILTIAVGTFAVGFNANLGSYMLESMDGDYLAANPSEARVYAYPLDDDMVKAARQVPGVDAVEGRSIVSGQILAATGKPVSIQFTSLKDASALTLNRLEPVRGETSLPPLHNKQILVDFSALPLGYRAGDTLLVELADGKQRELVLAGYIHDVTGIPFSFAKIVNAYVTPDTMEWLGGDPYLYGELSVSVAEKQTDAEHVTEVAQAVADRVESAGASDSFVVVYQPGVATSQRTKDDARTGPKRPVGHAVAGEWVNDREDRGAKRSCASRREPARRGAPAVVQSAPGHDGAQTLRCGRCDDQLPVTPRQVWALLPCCQHVWRPSPPG